MNGKFARRSTGVRVLTLVLAFVLVMGASVAGTLAWLTAETDEVINTFTSAKLFETPKTEFTLWEHEASDTDKDGEYTLSTTVKATDGKNDYNILPGVSIPKDPTVTIVNLLEDGYLFVKVKEDTLPEGLSWEMDTGWTEVEDGVYAYNSVIKADTSLMNVNIIKNKSITVARDYIPAEGVTEPYKLSFEAYMVQATGNGASAAEAWENAYGEPAAVETTENFDPDDHPFGEF